MTHSVSRQWPPEFIRPCVLLSILLTPLETELGKRWTKFDQARPIERVPFFRANELWFDNNATSDTLRANLRIRKLTNLPYDRAEPRLIFIALGVINPPFPSGDLNDSYLYDRIGTPPIAPRLHTIGGVSGDAIMIDRFFHWLKQPSTIASLIVAACLMVVGHYLNANNMLRGLTSFTAYLERSLKSFDAVNIAKVYYKELTGCQIALEARGFSVVCEPAPSLSDHLQKSLKGEREPGLITGIFVAFIGTLGRIGREATWLGIVIYILSFAAGGYWLARKLEVATNGPAGWLVWLVLTPAVASVIALGLRWLLLLFVKLFSPVLAGIAWVLAYFAAPFKWLGYGITLVTTAKDLQSVGEKLSSVEPPKNPPSV